MTDVPGQHDAAAQRQAAPDDKRSPNPPLGYSRSCAYPLEKQIHIVAEFHANRIRPERIAYRVGIDITFIRQLLEGQSYVELFDALVIRYRKRLRQRRYEQSKRLKGSAQYNMQQDIEQDYRSPLKVTPPVSQRSRQT